MNRFGRTSAAEWRFFRFQLLKLIVFGCWAVLFVAGGQERRCTELCHQSANVRFQPGTSLVAPASDLTLSPESGHLKNLSLEQLMQVEVSTVSRVDERIDEAPGSVYVYSSGVIQNRGYRSLGQLLQTVPGFTVFHRDLDFVVGVRGLLANDNDKVSLLINGQNVNGVHEQDFLNGPINLDNVERVEVVVGPSSLFQQGNTLAATINVITKDTEGMELVSGIGNNLRYSETLMGGHHWAPDRLLSFSISTEAQKGFNAWSPGAGLGVPGKTITGEIDQPNYFGIVHGQYGELSGQFIAYRSSWPELHIDNDPRNNGQMTESKYSLFLKAEHPFSDKLSGIARTEATLKEQTRLNADGVVPVNAEQQSLNQWDYASELGLRYTGAEHHVIQSGAQFEYDNNFKNYFTFLAPGQKGVIPKTSLFNKDDYDIGFYLDDEYRVADQWKLIGGARVDHSTRLEGNRWFPGARAAIIYEPTKTWVSKFIYNRSVRMPSALEALNDVWGFNHRNQTTAPPFARLSNPAMEPEILSTLEWDNIVYVGDARVGVNIYHQDMENFISFFQPHANGGNLHGEGVELNFEAPLNERIKLWANGAWNDSKLHLFNSGLFGPNPEATATGTESIHAYVNKSDRIIGSPAYTANGGVEYAITDHVTFSPSLRFFTEQAAADRGHYVTIHNQFYLDATLMWRDIAGKHMDFALSGYNLLDNRQAVGSPFNGSTYRPGGISFVASLTLRF